MRYFLDTEFDEQGGDVTIDLISIGIVCEDGRELYAISSEFAPHRCNDWVKTNVLTKLAACDCPGGKAYGFLGHQPPCPWAKRAVIADRIRAFVGDDPAPEFWAYYADYDWVLFCQLFGAMSALPKGWPMLCMDLKQYAIHLGVTESLKKLCPQPEGEHDALWDARWNFAVYCVLWAKDQKRSGVVA